MKVFIATNGCEEASLSAQRLKNIVSESNHVITNDPRLADKIIFYCCGHLSAQENESLRIIKSITRLKKNSAEFFVWGCLTKIDPEAVRDIYEGCMVAPEQEDFFYNLFNLPKERILEVNANELCETSKLTKPYPHLRPPFRWMNIILDKLELGRNESKKNWYIKIITGCRENCTYCSDRLAFNHCRSQSVDSIISQFELGLKNGFKNFYLVGRDLGSYGFDIDSDLPTLLKKMLSNHRTENYKLHLYNLSPRSLVDFYPKLIELFSYGKISQIGSHVQSGSDRILGLMGRRYATYEWMKTLKEIREKYPDIRFVTSLMVGFPTETELDFGKSMKLLDIPLFDQFDLYQYEEKPNSFSSKLRDSVLQKDKRKRLVKMRWKVLLNYIRNVRRIQIGHLIRTIISYLDVLFG